MNVGVNNRATAINQIFIGVNNVAKLVYQGGGGGSDFQLPTFTGSNSIFGDTTSGRIELYESGTLVLFPGTYDVFLVGGGASGGNESTHTQSGSATGGGGSGYTTTQKNITISERTEANVTVGAGGVFTYAIPYKSAAGGITSIQSSSFSNNAQGGKSTNSDTSGTDSAGEGTDGGSGGAARASARNEAGHVGGSNGSNGESNNIMGVITVGGVGQGTTTRAFGEEDGTLYAGGGGGGNITSSSGVTGSSAGGAGGGGNGGTYNSPDGGKVYNVSTAGTANTGGGGGGGAISSAPANARPQNGGSGIVIIRWNNTGGLSLGELAEGTLVTIMQNGSPQAFIVAKHNYESTLNGDGRTLMVRNILEGAIDWNTNGTVAYANSTIDTWLNNNTKQEFSNFVQQNMGSTTFYYTPSWNDNEVVTLSRSVFMLSLNEYGVEVDDGIVNKEGTPLSIPIAIARDAKGIAREHWTRTPYLAGSSSMAKYVATVTSTGAANYSFEVTDLLNFRPVFTLPDTLTVTNNGDGTYTLVES